MIWIDDIEIGFHAPSSAGLIVTEKGIDGWYDLPGVKSKVEEREGADGAFPLRSSDLEYSARTVTVHLAYVGDSREFAVDVYTRFNALAHKIVPVRVLDVDDTTVDGWIEADFGPKWRTSGEFAVTVNTSDPRRYESAPQRVQLVGGFDWRVHLPGQVSDCVWQCGGSVAVGHGLQPWLG